MHPQVDEYLAKNPRWKNEIMALRSILLDSELVEDWKWYTPCYTYDNNNVVIIYQFKEYMGIGFIKGSLMKDEEHILEKQGVNTRGVRLVKFHHVDEINRLKDVLKNYILEAIEIEKQGLQVTPVVEQDLVYPEELKSKFEQDQTFKKAFDALSLGRKRAYIIYFSGAKQSSTRQARIEKYVARILEGKGLNE